MLRLASINTRNLARDNSEWGLKLVATVHDENVYEVDEAYAKEAAKGIRKAFKEAVTLSLPLISKVKIGNHFGEIK
jgi:DNA polymerase I-like protein with 3'-5' exonuclease and polymerase domains